MPIRAASRSILAYTFLERPIHCINTRLFTTHSAKLRSHTTIPDCPPESLYTYSARRWLWDEPDQLQRRYVRFNINALIEIAEKAAGHDAVCVNLSRLPEGNSNKIFLAAMRDGQQIIVKIPNPNAGPKHYTTASEVATMSFARDRLNIPVPKPLDYCTDANRTNLGAEYIVMEKAPGVELSHIWDELKGRQKVSIVEQIADISCKLARARFPAYGALYKRRDVGLDESVAIDDEFVVGRTLGRAWFEDGRGHVDIHRGPWSSVEDLIKTVAQREAACIDNLASFRRDGQQGIFGGPGGYIPTREAKKSVLWDFLKICSYIRPKLDALSSGILWHSDLHTDNIFVDAENPSQITSIVDWQGVSINPIFLTAQHPFLIDHEGPRLEGLVQPALPENFDSLAPAEQMAAKRLFLSQTLWALYEVCIQRAAPELLQAFRHRDTLQGQILGLIGAIYDGGEPYVQILLADIAEEDIWKQVVGEDEDGNPSIPCPIWYSEQDKERQKTDLANWERDVERKFDVLHEIGLHAGWDGAVAPGDYDEVVRRLAAAKQRFLDRESANEQERARWEEAWPFQDTTG